MAGTDWAGPRRGGAKDGAGPRTGRGVSCAGERTHGFPRGHHLARGSLRGADPPGSAGLGSQLLPLRVAVVSGGRP